MYFLYNSDIMSNKLKNSRSPYLLQHAQNPVYWYPWGDEALKKAKEEHKLMIVSIGYSSCHWCHVMEKESFEDEEVAKLMNENFISIKVDREERPDIDHIYIQAATLITGHAGWPLNAIVLPDGRIVYAGTYFSKQNWMRVLNYFTELFYNDLEKLEEQAYNILHGLKEINYLPQLKSETKPEASLLNQLWSNWKVDIDPICGGRKGAPKFIMPNNFDFLLRYAYSSKQDDVKDFVFNSLKKIALGGIHDAVSGGFFRYSVDDRWHIPHFEKMLYDNAQLLSVYAQAYRYYKTSLFKEILESVFFWLQNEMKADDGGYFSALDADSEGEEGKYYLWTWEELEDALGEDLPVFADYYQCTKIGNWQNNQNHLHCDRSLKIYCEENDLNLTETQLLLKKSKETLRQKRAEKIRPNVDDKRITGWNALLISGLVHSFWATGDEKFLKAAEDITTFFEKKLIHGNRLWHTYNKGEAYQEAYLSDYAPAIQAYIHLYQATFQEKYLLQAKIWIYEVLEYFSDPESNLFFLNADYAEQLVHRPKELSDNVISSSNSIFARCLLQTGLYYDLPELREQGTRMFQLMLDETVKNGPFYSEWAIALWEYVYPLYEVVFTGEKASQKMLHLFEEHYLPQVLPIGSNPEESQIPLMENKTTPNFYVCRNQVCSAPVTKLEDVLKEVVNL